MSGLLHDHTHLNQFVKEFREEKSAESFLEAEKQEQNSNDQQDAFVAKATKCKLIALDFLNLCLSTNPSTLCPRDRTKIERLMLEWVQKCDKEVDSEFNSIVSGKLLL